MQTKRLVLLFLTCAVFGVAVPAGCGDDDDNAGNGATTEAPAAAETEEAPSPAGETAPSGDAQLSEKVEIVDFAYDPDPVTVEEGGKVIWINRDSAPHTATADDGSFDTGTLEEGKLKSESFKTPGEYAYICSIHPEMQGTVVVVKAS
ncbi:MAG TPA: cupredoxin family copper-binding protein [Solirubrobacterales bacterium]